MFRDNCLWLAILRWKQVFLRKNSFKIFSFLHPPPFSQIKICRFKNNIFWKLQFLWIFHFNFSFLNIFYQHNNSIFRLYLSLFGLSAQEAHKVINKLIPTPPLTKSGGEGWVYWPIPEPHSSEGECRRNLSHFKNRPARGLLASFSAPLIKPDFVWHCGLVGSRIKNVQCVPDIFSITPLIFKNLQ